ncbi:transposase, partial [Magnetovibrio blakemorei]
SDTVAQAAQMTGVDPERIYADRGYRGHNYEGEASVMLSGHKRGLSPQMKRELKRRSAIEATIGHMKTDGRLDRNFLKGQTGDAINALLVAAGHNMRLILNALAFWLAWIMSVTEKTVKIVKTDTSRLMIRYQTSMA